MGPNGIYLPRLSHLYAPAFSQDTSAKFTFYVIVICAPQKLKRKHVVGMFKDKRRLLKNVF